MDKNYFAKPRSQQYEIVADLLRIQHEVLHRDEPIEVTSRSVRRAQAMFGALRSLMRTIQIGIDDARNWEATARLIACGDVNKESLLKHAGKDVRGMLRAALMEAGEPIVEDDEPIDEQCLLGVLVTLVHLYPEVMSIDVIRSHYPFVLPTQV